MKNLTISLDEKTAQWLRVHAARHDKSVSRFVGELLEERRRAESNYDAARRAFLRRGPIPFRTPEQPLPRRDELYDRALLRR